MMVRSVTARAVRAQRVAFTLLEVLIVVAIIVMLAGVGGYYLFQQYEGAKDKRAFTDCVALAAEVEKYRVDHGDPASLQDLVANGAVPADKVKNPWGQDYTLDLSGRKARVFTQSPKGKLIESGPAGS